MTVTDLRPWTWPWLIATTLSRAVLAVVICLGLWGALPAAIGWHPTTVSSGSMLPRLHVGDVAVSRPVGRALPAIGTVLLFDDPDHPGRLRMHRFVRLDDDGRLVTRGDANPADDSSPIGLAAVRGIGTLRIPWVALPVVWIRERDWLPLGLAFFALIGLTLVSTQSRRFGFPEDDEDDEDGGDGLDPPVSAEERAVDEAPAPAHLVRRVLPRTVAAATALTLTWLVPAAAAFNGTTTGQATLGSATYFTCAKAVTASAPYLWYRMDETSSTATVAVDSSSGARNGVYGSAGKTAAATRACTTDAGRAMTFDGSSGYLSSPLISAALPNVFTLSIWFKTTTTRGGKLIGFGSAQTGASGVYDRHLYLTNTGSVVFGVYPNVTKTVESATGYNNGAWHQTVATLSSAGMRLYVDGELVDSDTTVTSAQSAASGYLRVAYDNLDNWPTTPTSRFFAGTLDEAAYFTSALTAAQVSAAYAARA